MEELINKYGKPRVFIVTYCLLAVLLAVEAAVFHGVYNSVSYKTQILHVRGVSNSGVVLADKFGNEMNMIAETPFGKASAFVDLDCTITYLHEELRYSYSLESGEGRTYTFSDGTTVAKSIVSTVIAFGSSSRPGLTSLQLAEKSLIDKLLDFYFSYKGIGFFAGLVFWGLLLLLIANVSLFYPELLFRLRTFMVVHGGEPTDFYLLMNKLSSIFMVGIVYFGMYLLVFRA